MLLTNENIIIYCRAWHVLIYLLGNVRITILIRAWELVISDLLAHLIGRGYFIDIQYQLCYYLQFV